jgi:hypothetical protein
MPIITVKRYSNGELIKKVSKEVTQEHVDKVNSFFDELSRRRKALEKKLEEKFKWKMPDKL